MKKMLMFVLVFSQFVFYGIASAGDAYTYPLHIGAVSVITLPNALGYPAGSFELVLTTPVSSAAGLNCSGSTLPHSKRLTLTSACLT
jgi:hypothetical protein